MSSCTEDADPVAVSSVDVTTTVQSATSVSTTVAETSTTTETTLPPTTTESSTTTTEPPPPGWTEVEAFPSLAYLPCCGSNWFGPRSPEIPADPEAGLLPGIYFASRIAGEVSTDTISFEVSRFEACAELPADGCESGPFGPDDMGVVEPPARGFKLPLDGTIRVGLSGFECEADQRMATAAELRPLMVDFDRAYDQFLGGPFEQGESADALVNALTDTPTGGFSAPDCPEFPQLGALVWQGDKGPPVLMQTQFAYDNVGDQSVPASASAEWIKLTAIEIAADGTPTLYFYAGYYS